MISFEDYVCGKKRELSVDLVERVEALQAIAGIPVMVTIFFVSFDIN